MTARRPMHAVLVAALGASMMPVSAGGQQRVAVRTIPNVIGRPVKEATDSLAWTRLPIVQLTVRTDSVRPGTVVAQRPPGGTPVTRARAESLWVASPVRLGMVIDPRAAVSVATATPPPARTSDDVPRPPANVVVNLAADSTLTRVDVPGIVVQARTKVPDLFKDTPQQVAADLERYRLRPGNISRDYSDDVSPGLVFRQHPPPGGDALAWTTVDVWYSVGPHPQPPVLAVPPVVGLTLREAADSLRNVGLGIGHVDRVVVPGARGRVVEQKPSAGSGAHRGDSVDVSVGVAPRPVKVPQVTGLPRSVAEDSLKAAGLGVGSVTLVSISDQAEVILRQQPGAGAPADSGSLVDLVENRRPETRLVRVPDLSGLSTAEAATVLRGDSPFLGNVRRPGEAAVDRVVGQEPPAGSDAWVYSAVDVTLGTADTGVDLVEVPYVTGLSADSARRVLVDRGFNRLSFRGGRGALTSGSVVVAQDPPGGQFANPELLVTLVTGAPVPPPEPVPDLVGLDPAVARGAVAVRGLQMVILDEVRGLRLSPVVTTQVPAPPLPPPPDNTVRVTVAIPLVPPIAAAFGGGVVVVGAGYTVRNRLRERRRRRKEDDEERSKDGNSSGVTFERKMGKPEITPQQPASGGLIRASLILRLEVTEGISDREAPAGSLIKSWKPRDG